jgi:hypothetical protein
VALDDRRQNLVAASIIGAAIVVSAFALAGIAWFLGWFAEKPGVSSPMAIAQPGSQLAGSAPPDAALLPGESVVDAQPKPAIPSYAKPAAPRPVEATSETPPPIPAAPPPMAVTPPPVTATTPAPRVAPSPAASPPPASSGPATPSYARRADPRSIEAPPVAPPPPAPPPATPAPATPSYAKRAEPKRSEPKPVEPESLCVNCGVISTVTFTSDTWDVAVRFEDGSREVFRYPERPRLKAGDKVRVEGDRLALDK